jgi:hypothetical protein
MTTVDRVARLEGLETTTDVALGWLDRVHEFPTGLAWLRAQARDGELDVARFGPDVDRIVAARQPTIDERERLRRTLYAEVFLRRSLAFALDAQVLKSAKRLDPILHQFLAWSGDLERPAPASTAVSAEAKTESATDPWTFLVAEQAVLPLDDVEVVEIARATIESRYFAGRAVPFADTRAKWSDVQLSAELVREIYRIPGDGDRGEDIARRARTQVSDLYDDARMSTFDHMGRSDLSYRITRWRLLETRPDRGRITAATDKRRPPGL